MKTIPFFIISLMVLLACSDKPSYSELEKQNDLLTHQLDSLKKENLRIDMQSSMNVAYEKVIVDKLNKKIDSLELVIDRMKHR